jgi:hypothetical protein
MRFSLKSAAATFAAATLLATIGSANADTFYNDLDATIDAQLETMQLTFDSGTLVGSTGSTLVSMREDDAPDHPNCNIQGVHDVTITATSSNESAVVLTNGPTYFFEACSGTVTVSVQAVGLGSSTISFAVTDANVPADWHVQWNTAPADFIVNVVEGGGGSTGCDADPAAPAWAAAILHKNGYKPGAKQTTNLISKIAGEMTQMAMFAGWEKGEHPQYENAVHARLDVLNGGAPLPYTAAQSARPGWVCVSII